MSYGWTTLKGNYIGGLVIYLYISRIFPKYDKRNGFSNFVKFKEFHFLIVSDTNAFL